MSELIKTRQSNRKTLHYSQDTALSNITLHIMEIVGIQEIMHWIGTPTVRFQICERK